MNIKDKDKFNELLIENYFEQVEKIEKLQKENKQLKEIIDKVIDKLGKYAIVIRSNGEAYTICVDILDILKVVR